jgi:hypothetical protein
MQTLSEADARKLFESLDDGMIELIEQLLGEEVSGKLIHENGPPPKSLNREVQQAKGIVNRETNLINKAELLNKRRVLLARRIGINPTTKRPDKFANRRGLNPTTKQEKQFKKLDKLTTKATRNAHKGISPNDDKNPFEIAKQRGHDMSWEMDHKPTDLNRFS